jgi:hypothetical protein
VALCPLQQQYTSQMQAGTYSETCVTQAGRKGNCASRLAVATVASETRPQPWPHNIPNTQVLPTKPLGSVGPVPYIVCCLLANTPGASSSCLGPTRPGPHHPHIPPSSRLARTARHKKGSQEVHSLASCRRREQPCQEAPSIITTQAQMARSKFAHHLAHLSGEDEKGINCRWDKVRDPEGMENRRCQHLMCRLTCMINLPSPGITAWKPADLARSTCSFVVKAV